GLRAGDEGQPQLQHARCAPRHQRHRAPALHPSRPEDRAGRGRSVLRPAGKTGFPRNETGRWPGGRVMAGDTTMQPLLVELGTEELPVKALPALGQAFFDGIVAGLESRGIHFERGESKPLYTPRRLAVLLPAVASEQPEQRSEVLGP